MSLRVKELWRYPVKSMGGERLTEAVLTEQGILHDRGWAVRDEDARTIRGAKLFGALMHCQARYLPETDAGLVPHAEITLPDGEVINTDDSRIHGRLSDLLDHRVTLWPLQPAEDEDHYRNNKPEADWRAAMRRTFALTDDEPLPDLSAFPIKLSRELVQFASPRGSYFDAFPINILTEASLRHLQTFLPQSQLDVRRFRPNILIADEDETTGLLENAWIGQDMTVGDVTLRVGLGCPRCIMVTRAQGDLPEDTTIMRALVRETNHSLSVYAEVLKTGLLRTDAPIVVAGDARS